MTTSTRAAAAALGLLALAASSRARADERPTLAGTWSASAMSERWVVGDWGEKCGPRPEAAGAPAGSVNVDEVGSELAMSGAGRSFRTDGCWEQWPGMSRSGHTASPRGWTTSCSTQADDPRQARITTTVTASDETLSIDETGQYQFVIEGQNCTASVRRSRSLRLARRRGEPVAEPPPAASAVPPAATALAPPTAPPTAPPAEKPVACAAPGPAARIEARPARKLMRPGERFTFRAAVADASGCALDVAPQWSIATPGARATVQAGGTVLVASDAEEGPIEVAVGVEGRSVRVRVDVASPARYASLLAERVTTADAGEPDEAAVAVIASASVGGASVVAHETAKPRRGLLAWGGVGLALTLAGVGVLLLRRRGASAEPAEDDEVAATRRSTPVAAMICPVCLAAAPAGAEFCPRDGSSLVRAGDESGPSAGGVCASCARAYPPDVGRCPTHGDALVPARDWRIRARREELARARGKICPTCGAHYPGDATFCGKDGTSLVLVN